MKESVLASFTAASSQVLEELGFKAVTITAQASRLDEESDVIVMIGLAGDLKGHFVLSFDHTDADSFIRLLHGHLGMQHPSGDEIAYRRSTIAEFANQLSGRSTALLSDRGMDAMITPPTVISGSSISACLPASNDRVAWRVEGNFGRFSCTIAVKP